MNGDNKCQGACLCGQVSFMANLSENNFHACHCTMCQRQNGGPYMGVKLESMPFINSNDLTWYNSSDYAERGFCNQCGSSLFWRMKEDKDAMCIVSVGSLKDVENLKLTSHIFVDGKPDYYEMNDGLPCLTEAEVLEKYS